MFSKIIPYVLEGVILGVYTLSTIGAVNLTDKVMRYAGKWDTPISQINPSIKRAQEMKEEGVFTCKTAQGYLGELENLASDVYFPSIGDELPRGNNLKQVTSVKLKEKILDSLNQLESKLENYEGKSDYDPLCQNDMIHALDGYISTMKDIKTDINMMSYQIRIGFPSLSLLYFLGTTILAAKGSELVTGKED